MTSLTETAKVEQEPKKLRETPPMEHFTQQVGETAIENCKILDSSTLLRKPDLQGLGYR